MSSDEGDFSDASVEPVSRGDAGFSDYLASVPQRLVTYIREGQHGESRDVPERLALARSAFQQDRSTLEATQGQIHLRILKYTR